MAIRLTSQMEPYGSMLLKAVWQNCRVLYIWLRYCLWITYLYIRKERRVYLSSLGWTFGLTSFLFFGIQESWVAKFHDFWGVRESWAIWALSLSYPQGKPSVEDLLRNNKCWILLFVRKSWDTLLKYSRAPDGRVLGWETGWRPQRVKIGVTYWHVTGFHRKQG